MADGRWSYRFSPLLSHRRTCRRNSSSTRWATRPCTMSASSNPASPIPEVVRCVPCALPLLGRRARHRTPSTATRSSAAIDLPSSAAARSRIAPAAFLERSRLRIPPCSHHRRGLLDQFGRVCCHAVERPSRRDLADATPQPPPLHPGACRSAMPSQRVPRYNELIGCDGREVGDACDHPHTLPTATAAGRPARTTPTRSQTWSNMSRSHAGPSALSVARYVFRERCGCRATRR
jgi:hypothetical protein